MKNKVILVSSNELGKGDKELGEGVLETFFTLLKQKEDKPQAIFFMNSGVYALTEKSFSSVHIKELEAAGVNIYACKTCVDYYGIQPEMIAGQISSMGHFIDLANQYEVITIS